MTCGWEDIRSISDALNTCVGMTIADTVGNDRVEVSDVKGEWRIPEDNLVGVIEVLIVIGQRWRVQQS